MRTILVTGFGPFPGAPDNPTAALVKRLATQRRTNFRVVGHVFETRYDAVDKRAAGAPQEAQAGRDPDVRAAWPRQDAADRDFGAQRPRPGAGCWRPPAPLGRDCPRLGPYADAIAGGQIGEGRAPGRHSRADLARCRQIPVQLPVLAGDRGGFPACDFRSRAANHAQIPSQRQPKSYACGLASRRVRNSGGIRCLPWFWPNASLDEGFMSVTTLPRRRVPLLLLILAIFLLPVAARAALFAFSELAALLGFGRLVLDQEPAARHRAQRRARHRVRRHGRRVEGRGRGP